MLATLEPSTLPMLSSSLSWMAARPETTTSGAEVPQATTVSPITRTLTPSLRAISAPAWTSQSPPLIRSAKPPTTSARIRIRSSTRGS